MRNTIGLLVLLPLLGCSAAPQCDVEQTTDCTPQHPQPQTTAKTQPAPGHPGINIVTEGPGK